MNLENHIGKQIESHALTPAGRVVLSELGGLYTVSPKLVDPDRDEGAAVSKPPHSQVADPLGKPSPVRGILKMRMAVAV